MNILQSLPACSTAQLRRPGVKLDGADLGRNLWQGKSETSCWTYSFSPFVRQTNSQPGARRLSQPQDRTVVRPLAGTEVPLVTEPPEQNNSGQRRTPATRGLRLGNSQEGNSTATVGGQNRGGSLRNPAQTTMFGPTREGHRVCGISILPLARGLREGKQAQTHTQAERG